SATTPTPGGRKLVTAMVVVWLGTTHRTSVTGASVGMVQAPSPASAASAGSVILFMSMKEWEAAHAGGPGTARASVAGTANFRTRESEISDSLSFGIPSVYIGP